MSNLTIHYNRRLMALIAGAAWFALIGQFYLILVNRVVTIPETILRYFSFFTILTNLIVAISMTVLLTGPSRKWGRFFSKPSSLTAITVYITVVGAVYNAILRFLWQPKGFQLIIDEMLHTAVPLLFVLFWAVCVPKKKLEWKMAFPWLIYPLLYMVWTVIHGMFSTFYPYPFVNVNELGYGRVLINAAMLFAFFLFISLVFIGIGKLSRRQTAPGPTQVF
jgi:hypothetical protein